MDGAYWTTVGERRRDPRSVRSPAVRVPVEARKRQKVKATATPQKKTKRATVSPAAAPENALTAFVGAEKVPAAAPAADPGVVIPSGQPMVININITVGGVGAVPTVLPTVQQFKKFN